MKRRKGIPPVLAAAICLALGAATITILAYNMDMIIGLLGGVLETPPTTPVNVQLETL